MASLSLPSRQILKRRVQTFGRNPVFRFGFLPAPEDAVRYWAMAEAGASVNATEDQIRDARNAVDWNGLYELDYARALRLDTAVHGTGQPRWAPAKDTATVPSNPVVIIRENPIPNMGPLITVPSSDEVITIPKPPAFQSDPPVTGPQNTGIPNPPGMTDTQYLEIVEKAKFDSAVIAAANAGRNAKQSDAEVATVDPISQAGRAKEGSSADIALTPPDPKIGSSKSLVIPAMAAIAAYLMFKG